MFARYLVTLCIVALLAASVYSQELESRNPLSNKLVKEGAKLIGKTFAGFAFNCLEEAAQKCKNDLKHPDKLIKCAGEFLKENKGRCLIE